jgi:hypothetical protein
MTDTQENKFNMYEAVIAVLDSNSSIWNSIPAIVEIKTNVETNIDKIRELRQIQEKDSTGITVNKAEIQENLIAATLKLIGGLMAYATVTNNHELRNSINYKKSDLEYTRDNILYDKALLVYNTAQPLAAELAVYLIGEEDILAVDTLLKEYEAAIPEKRAAVSESKAATQALKQTIKATSFILKDKLDNLMLIFQAVNPDFFNAYTNSRIIIDLGRRHAGSKTIISGIIEKDDTEIPINGAYVWIMEKGISFTTASDGRFSLNVGEAGTYTLKAEKQGYKTHTEDPITIEKGDEVIVEVEMEVVSHE